MYLPDQQYTVGMEVYAHYYCSPLNNMTDTEKEDYYVNGHALRMRYSNPWNGAVTGAQLTAEGQYLQSQPVKSDHFKLGKITSVGNGEVTILFDSTNLHHLYNNNTSVPAEFIEKVVDRSVENTSQMSEWSVYFFLYGLVDLILDMVLANKINTLDSGRHNQYLGLAALLGIGAIASNFVIDGWMGVMQEWEPGKERWNKHLKLMLCRACFEDATTIYAISRVGGIGEDQEADFVKAAQVSLIFSVIAFSFISLFLLLEIIRNIPAWYHGYNGLEFALWGIAGLFLTSLPILNVVIGIKCWFGVNSMPTGIYVIEILTGVVLTYKTIKDDADDDWAQYKKDIGEYNLTKQTYKEWLIAHGKL